MVRARARVCLCVCVVGMRGKQQGTAQWVCSCSIRRRVARAWTQRMRDVGIRGESEDTWGRTKTDAAASGTFTRMSVKAGGEMEVEGEVKGKTKQ